MNFFSRVALFAAGMTVLASPLAARLDRVEVLERVRVWDGRYEWVSGKLHYAVDPANRFNRPIVDLDKADRNADGKVEFAADFGVLRPVDPAKGNGTVLLEVPNRGNARALGLLQGGTIAAERPVQTEDLGDAWLMRRGFTLAWVGWQWDVPPTGRYRLYAPKAYGPGHAPIRGMLRDDFVLAQRRTEVPLGHVLQGRIGGTEYAVDDPNDPRSVLTVRNEVLAERQVIPRTRWSFGADRRSVAFADGFEPGRIYELIYPVRDPVVAGLGFAALRDFAAAVKEGRTELGTGHIERAYAMGISQCGRFLRQMLYQGFDADESGKIAFDGIISDVAGAGRGSFNLRFAQPSRDAEPFASFLYPVDVFPFSAADGLFAATQAEGIAPKIFLTNNSHEYWAAVASLISTDPRGTIDREQPENVRAYFWPGHGHFPWLLPAVKGTGDMAGQNLINPNPVRWLWRAMIDDMDQWVRGERPPPETNVPKLRDGSLVSLRDWHFPEIPGVNRPAEANVTWRLDFGPRFKEGIVDIHPPKVGPEFPRFLPQTDADGNELRGVRMPELEVPVATYTGWNLRSPEIGAPNHRASFIGSYLPFARTVEEREKSGDPRRSLAERYASKADYLRRYRKAVDALVGQHWALPEDIDALMQRGELEWDCAAQQ